MTYNFNDVEPHQGTDLIPDGSFAKVVMTVRPGGVDGQGGHDKGLLKASNTPGSDVLSLDCEFTVAEGPHARRKFWQLFTAAGGKVDENGASIGWNISKRMVRAMIDSALGLDPEDMSDAARQKRQLRGLADLNGIAFVARIMVEPNNDPRYPDRNRLDRPVLPNEKEWRAVMNGEAVPPAPSRSRGTGTASPAPAQTQAAWQQPQAQPAPASAAPAWQQTAAQAATQAAPQGHAAAPAGEGAQPAPSAAQPAPAPVPSGPDWLNG